MRPLQAVHPLPLWVQCRHCRDILAEDYFMLACRLQVVGGDPDKDVAVLQLDAPPEKLAELKPISVGTSANLQVGQKARAHCPTILTHTY